MNIFDVMGYGAIVHHNEEFGILITANGSLLNWWNESGSLNAREWDCVDCRGFDLNDSDHWGLMGLPLHEVMDRAEEWVEEELASIIEQQNKQSINP